MRRSQYRRRAEINIVPLVDVLIVLIFFFLMSMQFRDSKILNITLPKIETAGKNKALEQLEIAVDTEGKFYFNGAEISKGGLEEAVKVAAYLPLLTLARSNSDSCSCCQLSIFTVGSKVGGITVA